MRNPILKTSVAALMIFACAQVPPAKNGTEAAASGNLERVIIFAIQQEAKTSELKGRRDLCVGFGYGLALDEKAVFSGLKRGGIKARASRWCNEGGRGLRIDVLAPVSEVSRGTFEVTVEVGDPSIKPGTDFATLLKRGTYVIRCERSSEPRLVSYRRTCCSATP